MRDSIAKGEPDGESSYVTRWDAATKRADVVAGKWVELRTGNDNQKELGR
jgi:hypothetical protein